MKKQIIVSDLTGEAVEDPVLVTLKHGNAVFELDVDAKEELFDTLRKVARRKGRAHGPRKAAAR